MACCKCCCGNKDCAEGEAGKCCCGGTEKTCCKAGEYCCDWECKSTPCSGACCHPTFGCSQPADEETCTSLGGTWIGYGIPCDPNPCPGACCDTVFGGCTKESQADCEENGRTFLGVGIPCGNNTCECTRSQDCTPPAGAAAECCDGVCKNTQDDTGFCRRPDGTCFSATYDDCQRDNQSNVFDLCDCPPECQACVDRNIEDDCGNLIYTIAFDRSRIVCEQDYNGTWYGGSNPVTVPSHVTANGDCGSPTTIPAKTYDPCTGDEVTTMSLEPRVLFGPGTELKKLLSKIGITASPTCSCNAKAKVMDERGIAWCEDNTETICDWLQEEATKRKLPFVRLAGKALIHMAIRRAKKGTNK